jgi:Amt family ammonium transporter
MKLWRPTVAIFFVALGIAFYESMRVPEAIVATGTPVQAGDVAWMLTASGLVMLMTPGLSFFYAGMVRGKNLISTLLQSFIALAVVSLLWVTVGFSLAFGTSIGGIIGDPRTFFLLRGVGGAPDAALCPTIPLALFALFQLKFAVITPALVTGAFAERVRFSAYVLFMVLFTLLVYAPLAHATWHPDGILRRWGVLDYAGGTVVHVSAGIAALAGARFLGQRRDHDAPHEPANIPFVVLGTGMLWFGWFGFNAGSALAANESAVSAFMATNTASAAACVAWLLVDSARGRKPSAVGACIGAVVGLVTITPAAGYVGVGASIVIGATLISNVAVHLKTKSTLDDTLDVFPCHGVGGMVGMILTGVFAVEGGLVRGKTELFLHHVAALAIVAVATYGMSALLYRVVNALAPLRVSVEDETIGLDLSQHGESIYESKARPSTLDGIPTTNGAATLGVNGPAAVESA